MKFLKSAVVILLGLSLGVAVNIGRATDANDKSIDEKTAQAQQAEQQPTKTTAEANSTAEPNEAAPQDPDLVEFEKAFEKAEKRAMREAREWTRRSIHNRINLLEMAYEQVSLELEFLAGIAAEEGASKTVKAIELLSEKRSQRFEQIRAKLKEQQERDDARQTRGAREKGKAARGRERGREPRRRD